MKFRIIGTLFLVAVLGGVFVMFVKDDNTQNAPVSNVQQANPEDNALKGLKIN